MEKKNKTKKSDIAIITIEILIGVVFFAIGGARTILFKDSDRFIIWSYVSAGQRRMYILYPGLLKLCRIIFGEESYIDAIWWIQSVFAFMATHILARRISVEYELKGILRIICFCFLLTPYSFMMPEAAVTHYVFTEGISISLFYLSWFFVIGLIQRLNAADMILMIAVEVLMFFTRTQLIIFLPISIAILLFTALFRRYFVGKEKRWCIVCVLSMLIGMLTIHVAYNLAASYLCNGTNVSQLVEALSGRAVTTIGLDTSEHFDGADAEIVSAIYDRMKEEGTSFDDFPESVMDYEDMHVIINTNTRDSDEVMWEYYRTHRMTENGEDYRSKGRIVSKLMDINRFRFYSICMRLMPSSLVASIFVQPKSIRLICYFTAAVIYACALLLIIVMLFTHMNAKYRLFLSSVLFSIFVNATFCNLILYGQQRYVIYCMGLFYVSLMIAFEESCKIIKSRKVSGLNGSV